MNINSYIIDRYQVVGIRKGKGEGSSHVQAGEWRGVGGRAARARWWWRKQK